MAQSRSYQPDPTIKPPFGAAIDPEQPMARGLSRFWCFNEGVGQRFADSASGDSARYTRAATDTAFVGGDQGSIFSMGADGSSATCTAAYTSGLAADSVTVACRFKISTSNGFFTSAPGAGSGDAVFSCRSPASAISPTLCYSNNSSVNFAFAADSNSLLRGAKSSVVPAAGVWTTLVGTYARDTSISSYGGTWTVYVAGVSVGSNNLSLAGTFGGTFSDAPVQVGRQPTSTSTSGKFLDWLGVWRRCLTADEVASLTAAPFQMFAASPVRRFYSVRSSSSRLLSLRRKMVA